MQNHSWILKETSIRIYFQNNLKASQKQGLEKISLTIGEMNSSYSALENRLEAGENSIKANAEKLINMNKIKSDIDLIKYTLNSASPSSVRAVANGKSVIPSDALDSLRNLIDNVNSDVNQLEVKTRKMPSVRLELTTFRLWDWRANQLRQEGSECLVICMFYNINIFSSLTMTSKTKFLQSVMISASFKSNLLQQHLNSKMLLVRYITITLLKLWRNFNYYVLRNYIL